MPVHIYGRVCNMDKIMEIANKKGLRVIEDCCEAQGAMWNGKMVGSYDIGVFSFFINKIIPAEEGGIITTNDAMLTHKANFLKSMSFNEEHDYIHDEVGFNYRMSNAQARFVLYNLSIANEIQAKRYQIESWYDQYIDDKYKMPKRDVVWVYDIKHPNKDEVVRQLNELGINARHSFKPMSMQPMYDGKYEELNAYRLSKEVCYLPVSPMMTEDLVKNICKIVNAVV